MPPVFRTAADAVATAHSLIERHMSNARQTLQFNEGNGVDPVITWDAITQVEAELCAGCGALMELFGHDLQLSDRLTAARAELQAMASPLLDSPAEAPKGV